MTFRTILSLTCLLSGAGLPVSSASGYNISLRGRVHERMTRLAEICASMNPMPERCPVPNGRKAFQKVAWKQAQFRQAVRWSDDPTRQGDIAGAVKFAVNVGVGRCKDYLEPGRPFAGLLCNSHYGRMQFMHAMASNQNETTPQTRGLISAWTRFAFGVASGRIPASAPYCGAVREQGAPLADALAPADFPFCEAGKYPAWTVGTLFTLKCSNPISSITCTEAVSPEAEELARSSATGALLHMIQDSYSRSHASRLPEPPTNGPYLTVVDCRPVTSFHLYARNKRAHGAADKLPTFSDECQSGGDVIDPVTASARMLRLVDSGSADDAVMLIDRKVLGNVSP